MDRHRITCTLPAVAVIAGYLAAALLEPVVAQADRVADDFTFFTSPSGNIGCVITPAQASSPVAYVRCDIRERDWEPPPRPADCPEFTGYGQGIGLDAGQLPRVVCAGDTAFGGGGPLAYGDSISAGVVRCTSAKSGITCRDGQSGHGFTLARQGYQLF